MNRGLYLNPLITRYLRMAGLCPDETARLCTVARARRDAGWKYPALGAAKEAAALAALCCEVKHHG